MSDDPVRPTDPEMQGLIISHLDFPVVGIGASAGGMQALLRMLENMPAKMGVAFVVILHLSPKHDSHAAEILQRATRMPVRQVTAPMPIEMDHVYVIPPSQDLTMNDGYLRVAQAEPRKGSHIAIDMFFRTLGQVHAERAVAVVLSGAGTDGAVGLTRVKEHGGVTLVQAIEDAEYDSMPRAAIATGLVDFVLPAAEMPQKLMELWENARRIRLPADVAATMSAMPEADPRDAHEAESALHDIMLLLRSQMRHDFRHYKRATVLRRIERRMQVRGLEGLPAYRDYLREHPEEAQPLLQDMLISVTNFFRDRDAFEALEREVVPKLFENQSDDAPIRAWVAGCATGEEAYSIAMLLFEQSSGSPSAPDLQVFATDVDERAIVRARSGLYPSAIVTDVTPSRLRQFFVRDQDQYRISNAVREKVLFASHNVLLDPPFSRLDLICCRNLLIYLNREAQTTILEMFRFALKPGGYLFLGTSESADAAGSAFTVVDKKNRIYRASTSPLGARHLPMLSEAAIERRPGAVVETAREPRRMRLADLHRRALEEVAAPSVLLDADYNILHLSPGVGRFMEHGGGMPSHNLLSNVHPELQLELRTALFKAAQMGRGVDARGVRMHHANNVPASVHIRVRPFRHPEIDTELTLVIFEEEDESLRPLADGAGSDSGHDLMVAQLEAEIKQFKEHLQETIEQSEASTEELKASNEELQAMNEELHSATEELETSKEELQSINEELITVNFELKVKVEETGRINDDLQNLVASTDIATVFVDSGMRIKRFTPQAVKVFNLIGSDLGRSLLDITHKLDYESLADDASHVFHKLTIIERQVRSVDGKHYLARIHPYRTMSDKIEGAVLTFIEVTALHEAEERLRQGEQRVRIAAETTRDYAILTFDEEGRITTWNAGAERVFGFKDGEAIGEDLGLIFSAEDRQAGQPQDEMRRAREEGRAEDERWHVRKDGSLVYCSGVTTPLVDPSSTGFVKIARDITASKQLEIARDALLEREKAVREQAQVANEAKDEFLAVMSHELKNPLNLIQVNAELLVLLPEVQSLPGVIQAGNTIRRAVKSQAQIIDDLLDLSRVRTGKLALRLAPVRLHDIVALIVQAVRNAAQAKGIEVVLESADPEASISGDAVRTEQIVWNLVSNAVKFTPPGGRVTVRLEPHDGFMRLQVSDTGQGIAPEFLPRVFGMFTQEIRRNSRGEGGLGIGLALVQELTVAQGGRVLAESDGLGRGSRFSVWLPIHRIPASALASTTQRVQTLRGLRILCVDDLDDALETFALLLRAHGAAVVTARNGLEALDRLRAADAAFDLAVSDIGMAAMDGYELIREIRADPHWSGLKCIALSGYGRDADAQRALAAGYDAHLAKPVSIDELKRTVERLQPARATDRPAD
jgi:two-component system CheB/CheR fusion protein